MRVAITGGIAEGKSTVMAMIREEGHSVLSSDDVAREVIERPEIQLRIKDAFGEGRMPSRSELRQRLANDPSFRADLDAIMHPPIIDAIRQSSANFIEVPLLYEVGMEKEFDLVWVVTCGLEEQVRRLRDRYGDEIAPAALIAAQMPSVAKAALADRVIRTNQPIEHVREEVKTLIASLRI